MIKHHNNCRSCGGKLDFLFSLKDQTIQGSFVYPNKLSPPTRKIPLYIMKCDDCHLIQNDISISPDILYSNYGYRSSVSNTMKNHLNDISKEITKLAHDKIIKNEFSILDIAANDGFFLKQFGDDFKIKYAIDPSDVTGEIRDSSIKVINECFPSKKIERNFDIITSIACFYDIEEPVKFCTEICNHLDDQGFWVAEFAYLPAVIKNLAYDGMVHEHICLYSLSTFENILKRTGLKIFKVEENDTNSGSLQVWITKEFNNIFDRKEWKEELLKLKIKEFELLLDDRKVYFDFNQRIIEHSKKLRDMLAIFKSEGKKIHIYGMSTKLNTILQYCDIGPELIEFAADRSKEKWGAKTISGIRIISEEESRAMKPDLYLVGPYHFKLEIIEREKETIKNGTKFLFPLPEIEII